MGRPCCSGMMCVLDSNFTDHGSVTRALPQHRDKVRAPSKPVSRGWGEARGCSFWPTMKKHTSALKQVHFPGLHSKGMRRTSWLLTFDSIPEFLFLDKWITNISTAQYTLESSFRKRKVKSLCCVQLWDPMDCSLPASSIHEIFQARILEWVAMSFSRVSSQPRDQTQVSHIAGSLFTVWATREAKKVLSCLS